CGVGETCRTYRATIVHMHGLQAYEFRTIRAMGRSCVGYEEKGHDGGEGRPVRLVEIVGDNSYLARIGIGAIDMAGADLAFRPLALIVGEDAVGRVREPDRTVRLYHRIVGRVEALAFVAVCDDADGAVMLGACAPARKVLASDQPALGIDRIAVGVI